MTADQDLTVVFDLGDVVLNWDPYAAFTGLLSRSEVDAFFRDIDFLTWNGRQDAGRGWPEAEAELVRNFPRYAHLAGVYRVNYERVVSREIDGTAAILRELAQAGTRLLSITNWSAELFDRAYRRFDILSIFEGIVVSGVEHLVKPDPRIFECLFARYGVRAGECLFIDDTIGNVQAARALGMRALHFTGAPALRADLAGLGLPLSR